MPTHAFDLVVNNFTCPAFHSCTLMDSLSDCEEKIQTGVATLCQNVTTTFVNIMKYRCGKSTCSSYTDWKYSGPDQVMALFHDEAREKMYKYVAENGLYIAAAGMGAIAAGYLTYRIIEKLNRTPESLKNIEFSELASRLERAEVVDDGNEILLERSSETVSYRQISRHIEQLYSDSVSFMRDKHALYQRRTFIDIIFYGNRPPILNHYEEAKVRSAMQLRERTYDLLNDLQGRNPGFPFTVLTRIWNYTIDKMSSRANDSKLLEEMVSRRKAKESIKPNLEWGSRTYAEGKNLQSRVIFAVAMIRGIFELVNHIALMATYSCLVLSKIRGETVALVAKDASEDLDNLRTAALGVFSPESVPVTKAKETIILY